MKTIGTLFFSLRLRSPNKKSTAKHNISFVDYIATRIGTSLNSPEYKAISIEELENILLNDPMVQFYLHEKEELNEDISQVDDNSEIDVKAELLPLCKELLSKDDLDQIGDDYKLQLLHLGKKINALTSEKSYLHGLFGKLHDKFGDIGDLKGTKAYIDQQSKKGTIMYHSLISFSPEDAKSLGFFDAEPMKKLLRENILIISDKLGIPPSRLEYVASVHMKPTNPHVHFMFWDKEQGVQLAFVHKSVANDIRIELINNVYKKERDELFKIKNAARDILTKGIGIQFTPVADFYLNLSDKDYLKEKKATYSMMGRLFNTRLKPSFIKELGKDYLNIIERLPKKGRINYQFLKPEVKTMVDNVIYKLINENEDFKREYNKFLKTAVDGAKMYSKNSAKHKEALENAEKDIIKRMANRLLDTMKEVKKRDTLAVKDKAYQKQLAINITSDLFQIFMNISRPTQQRQGELKALELSKEAKIELARKLESASTIDWERD